MNFIINGISLATGGGRVVGINFARQLQFVDKQNRYLLISPKGFGYEDIPHLDNVHFSLRSRKVWSSLARPYFDNHTLPRLCKRFSANALLTLNNIGPFNPPCPHVVLIMHPYYLYPESVAHKMITYRSRLRMLYELYAFKQTMKGASWVIAQTPIMAERLATIYGIDESRIHIIPIAVGTDNLLPPIADSPWGNQINKYHDAFKLLCLSRYYSHKNIEVIVPTIMKLHERGIKDIVCVITIAPDQHPHAKTLLKKIQALKLENDIINIGPVQFEHLGAVYTRCDALLFPTLLESLSATYLEAMHYGLPIITSDLDFALCICGDSAIYFNPMDYEDIADKIQEVYSNVHLRKALTEKGRKRLLEHFTSWEDVARQYVGLLYEASRTL